MGNGGVSVCARVYCLHRGGIYEYPTPICLHPCRDRVLGGIKNVSMIIVLNSRVKMIIAVLYKYIIVNLCTTKGEL